MSLFTLRTPGTAVGKGIHGTRSRRQAWYRILPLLLIAQVLRAQDPGDSAWWSNFTAPLPYNSGTSFIGASNDAMFFAGGYGNPATLIPAFSTVLRRGADGALRAIRGGVNHSVSAMTVTPAGHCYIAVFSDVLQNGNYVRHYWIEHWNGLTWTVLPQEPNHEVKGLAVQGGRRFMPAGSSPPSATRMSSTWRNGTAAVGPPSVLMRSTASSPAWHSTRATGCSSVATSPPSDP